MSLVCCPFGSLHHALEIIRWGVDSSSLYLRTIIFFSFSCTLWFISSFGLHLDFYHYFVSLTLFSSYCHQLLSCIEFEKTIGSMKNFLSSVHSLIKIWYMEFCAARITKYIAISLTVDVFLCTFIFYTALSLMLSRI